MTQKTGKMKSQEHRCSSERNWPYTTAPNGVRLYASTPDSTKNLHQTTGFDLDCSGINEQYFDDSFEEESIASDWLTTSESEPLPELINLETHMDRNTLDVFSTSQETVKSLDRNEQTRRNSAKRFYNSIVSEFHRKPNILNRKISTRMKSRGSQVTEKRKMAKKLKALEKKPMVHIDESHIRCRSNRKQDIRALRCVPELKEQGDRSRKEDIFSLNNLFRNIMNIAGNEKNGKFNINVLPPNETIAGTYNIVLSHQEKDTQSEYKPSPFKKLFGKLRSMKTTESCNVFEYYSPLSTLHYKRKNAHEEGTIKLSTAFGKVNDQYEGERSSEKEVTNHKKEGGGEDDDDDDEDEDYLEEDEEDSDNEDERISSQSTEKSLTEFNSVLLSHMNGSRQKLPPSSQRQCFSNMSSYNVIKLKKAQEDNVNNSNTNDDTNKNSLMKEPSVKDRKFDVQLSTNMKTKILKDITQTTAVPKSNLIDKTSIVKLEESRKNEVSLGDSSAISLNSLLKDMCNEYRNDLHNSGSSSSLSSPPSEYSFSPRKRSSSELSSSSPTKRRSSELCNGSSPSNSEDSGFGYFTEQFSNTKIGGEIDGTNTQTTDSCEIVKQTHIHPEDEEPITKSLPHVNNHDSSTRREDSKLDCQKNTNKEVGNKTECKHSSQNLLDSPSEIDEGNYHSSRTEADIDEKKAFKIIPVNTSPPQIQISMRNSQEKDKNSYETESLLKPENVNQKKPSDEKNGSFQQESADQNTNKEVGNKTEYKHSSQKLLCSPSEIDEGNYHSSRTEADIDEKKAFKIIPVNTSPPQIQISMRNSQEKDKNSYETESLLKPENVNQKKPSDEKNGSFQQESADQNTNKEVGNKTEYKHSSQKLLCSPSEIDEGNYHSSRTEADIDEKKTFKIIHVNTSPPQVQISMRNSQEKDKISYKTDSLLKPENVNQKKPSDEKNGSFKLESADQNTNKDVGSETEYKHSSQKLVCSPSEIDEGNYHSSRTEADIDEKNTFKIIHVNTSPPQVQISMRNSQEKDKNSYETESLLKPENVNQKKPSDEKNGSFQQESADQNISPISGTHNLTDTVRPSEMKECIQQKNNCLQLQENDKFLDSDETNCQSRSPLQNCLPIQKKSETEEPVQQMLKQSCVAYKENTASRNEIEQKKISLVTKQENVTHKMNSPRTKDSFQQNEYANSKETNSVCKQKPLEVQKSVQDNVSLELPQFSSEETKTLIFQNSAQDKNMMEQIPCSASSYPGEYACVFTDLQKNTETFIAGDIGTQEEIVYMVEDKKRSKGSRKKKTVNQDLSITLQCPIMTRSKTRALKKLEEEILKESVSINKAKQSSSTQNENEEFQNSYEEKKQEQVTDSQTEENPKTHNKKPKDCKISTKPIMNGKEKKSGTRGKGRSIKLDSITTYEEMKSRKQVSKSMTEFDVLEEQQIIFHFRRTTKKRTSWAGRTRSCPLTSSGCQKKTDKSLICDEIVETSHSQSKDIKKQAENGLKIITLQKQRTKDLQLNERNQIENDWESNTELETTKQNTVEKEFVSVLKKNFELPVAENQKENENLIGIQHMNNFDEEIDVVDDMKEEADDVVPGTETEPCNGSNDRMLVLDSQYQNDNMLTSVTNDLMNTGSFSYTSDQTEELINPTFMPWATDKREVALYQEDDLSPRRGAVRRQSVSRCRGTGRAKPEKPFVCTICGDRHQYEAVLEDHYRMYHNLYYST